MTMAARIAVSRDTMMKMNTTRNGKSSTSVLARSFLMSP
jgi:hypothetical protein